jgi:hypothetical protein
MERNSMIELNVENEINWNQMITLEKSKNSAQQKYKFTLKESS